MKIAKEPLKENIFYTRDLLFKASRVRLDSLPLDALNDRSLL